MRRIAHALARAMAVLGGLVLTALIALTCVSILGRELRRLALSDPIEAAAPWAAEIVRTLGIGAVPGVYELTEAGVAFAIFAFLPICQARLGHASVGVFVEAASPGLRRALIALWEIAIAVVVLTAAWRLGVGLAEKWSNGQTTFILRFPVWWSYAASFAAATAAAALGVFLAADRAIAAVHGEDLIDEAGSPPLDPISSGDGPR